MLHYLIKLANKLDELGYIEVADHIDNIIKSASSKGKFKYDPNSGPNEGRWRLTDPEIYSKFWRTNDKKDKGISYIMGKESETGETSVQAIRFDKKLWSEEKARKWWSKNKKRFTKIWTENDWKQWKKENKKAEIIEQIIKIASEENSVLAHIAGPSGSGKTYLGEQLKVKYPTLTVKDLDEMDDLAAEELFGNKPKKEYTDDDIRKLAKKRQELLDDFIASNKNIVFVGHHTEGDTQLNIPTQNRWMLNTPALTSAYRAYLRSQNEKPEHRRKLEELPLDYKEAKDIINQLKQMNYKPHSPKEIEQMVAGLIQKENAADDFDKEDHNWDEVLIQKDGITKTRGQIKDYYMKNIDKIFQYVKDKNIIVILGVGKNKTVLKRNLNGKKIHITEKNGIDNPNSLEYWIWRRMIEIHISLGLKTDFVFVDLDPHSENMRPAAKKIILKVDKVIKDIFSNSKIVNYNSGKRGYHCVGYLKQEVDIDKARHDLKQALDEAFKDDKNATTGIAKNNQIRLDTSILHNDGSIRAPYSMTVYGKIKEPLS